ncbi:MAG: hypothetical protein J2P31_12950 [Blastocatellia bacterium]|nr:hypothetical protein [Blastocatellia bacterium]
MTRVVVVDRDPVERGAEIPLDLAHQIAREAAPNLTVRLIKTRTGCGAAARGA